MASGVELDCEVLEQLRKVGGEKLLDDLFELYLTHTPPRLEAVRDGLAEDNPAAVGSAIHSLRSSSATLGATDLADSLGELEGMAAAGEEKDLATSWPEVEEVVLEFLRFLRGRKRERGR